MSERPRCPRCRAPHTGLEGEPCPACLLRLGLEEDAPTLPAAAGDLAAARERIASWRVVQPLGEGGMGVVYLVEEEGPLKRRAALKRVKHGLDSKRVLERFDQERRVLARMDHPGIARVLDAGADEDGVPFFVMEYVEGVSITTFCDERRLRTRERLALFERLCDAVEHAHRRGILHRDLKPSNILVVETADGPQPKVIDFGVARATAQRRMEWSVFTEYGRLIGTPEYMSPEQADLENDDLDTRSDVYSLGIVLYELLVGKTPHDARSLRELGLEALLKTIREGTFPTPSSRLSTLGDEAEGIAEVRGGDFARLRRVIAGELDWIVMRATHRDRDGRYGSPRELGEDIRRYLEDLPVDAGPPTLGYRAKKFVRRHRTGVTLAVVVLAAVAIGVAGLAIGLDRALEAEKLARQAEQRAKENETRAQTTADFLVRLFREVSPEDEPIHELKALDALDRGAERIQQGFEDEPMLRARILHTLGRTYEELDLFDRARPLLEQALELRKEHAEPGDPALAYSYFSVGVLHIETDDHRGAIPLLEKAIELLDASDQDPPQAVASPLRSLANALRYLGESERAEPIQRRAVEVARETRAEDPGIYGVALDNLAGMLFESDRYEEAEAMWLEALEVHRGHAPDGTSVGQVLSNMAIMYSSWRRFLEALDCAREAAEIYTRVLGQDNPRTSYARLILADALQNVGQAAEAAAILERELPLLEEKLGPAHMRTTVARLKLVQQYQHEKRWDDAQALAERQLELIGDHPDAAYLAPTLNRLASIHWAKQEYEEALRVRERSERVETARYGPEHSDVATSITIQGWCLRKLGRYDEAYERLDRSLKILRAADTSLPENQLKICDNLEGFARLQADLGDHEAAVEMFEELSTTLSEIMGEEYAPLAEIYGEYAKSLRALGRDDEAMAIEARQAREGS